ncbi:hypothetical protein EJB05_12305 [Eragrostis curvula]|uniref:Uncharacterized protein n=1 Tax=Eragrostis curvula TaxID=38414 RepID=A0A5J9VRX9_9POAL|nr:hypothetical protein EJB05_12305 [Eragrostis curvula]
MAGSKPAFIGGRAMKLRAVCRLVEFASGVLQLWIDVWVLRGAASRRVSPVEGVRRPGRVSVCECVRVVAQGSNTRDRVAILSATRQRRRRDGLAMCPGSKR